MKNHHKKTISLHGLPEFSQKTLGAVPDHQKSLSGPHGRAELPYSPENQEKAAAAQSFKQNKQRPRHIASILN